MNRLGRKAIAVVRRPQTAEKSLNLKSHPSGIGPALTVIAKHVLRFTAICGLTAVVMSMGAGCTTVSSSIQAVPMALSEHQNTAFYIMPFEPPEKQLVAKDRRAIGNLGALDILMIQSIKEANPSIYNYTINVRDLKNLRQSLLTSIESTRAFRAVEVAPSSPEVRQPNALYLIVRLDEAGIVGDFNYYAVFKGTARLEDAGGSLLGERRFDVKRMGAFTVAQSKNKAIRDVVKEVGELITSVAAAQRPTPKN